MRFTLGRASFFALVAGALGVQDFGCSADSSTSSGRPPGAGGSSASSDGSGASGSSGVPAGGASGTLQIDSGTSGGTSAISPDSGCATSTAQGTLIPANLLFVIDRSGSMNCNPPNLVTPTRDCEQFPAKEDPSQPSKWEITRDALKNAIAQLEQSGIANVGLTMFPVAGTDCTPWNTGPSGPVPDIAIKPLDATQQTAIDSFLNNVNPAGKTPLIGATVLAYQYVFNLLKSGQIGGNNFVVLLTDGFETCVPTTDQPSFIQGLLTQDVPNAVSVGIRTFAIGVPGSEDSRALLSEIAWLGGTASDPNCVHDSTLDTSGIPAQPDSGTCHFDLTTTTDFATDLTQRLKDISGTVLSCELDVPAAAPGTLVDLTRVNVDVNDQFYGQSNGCNTTGTDGWTYNADKTKIILCGTACDQAKQPTGKVVIVLGCQTIPA